MNDKNQDRRVRRTRKLLKDSLIALMHTQEFKNISVKDITDQADLNRGTFYLHYSDIYSLLHEIQEEMLQDFQDMIDEHYLEAGSETSLLGIMVPIVNYISENRAVCQIMFENNASDNFMDQFHKLIHENGKPILRSLFPNAAVHSEKRYELFIEYATYGVIGMIRHWVHSGQSMPTEDLAQMLNDAVLGTAERLLRTSDSTTSV